MVDGCCDVEVVYLGNVYDNCMNSYEEMMVVSLPNFEIMCISCRIVASISQEFTTVFLHWVNGVLKVSHVSLTSRVFVVLLSNPNQVKHELSDHGGFKL